MLKLRFENPDGEAYPRLAEFKKELRAAVNNFEYVEPSFQVSGPQEERKAGSMGEPFSLTFLIELVQQYQAEVITLTALLNLIKIVRDLYLSFVSERIKRDDRENRKDNFFIFLGNKPLRLPATDKEIEDFISKNEAAIRERE